jgi:Fuc2NAc and GlcNAc transferase
MNMYLPLIAFLFGWLITLLVCRYATILKLVHQPNERSSHTKITPHGGGLGIIASFFLISLWLMYQEGIYAPVYWGVIALCLLVALVGLIDDIIHLSAIIRLIVHASVSLLVYLGISTLPLPDIEDILGLPFWLTVVLIVFAGSWWINLFNFMDGIDGLAATQAIFILLSAVFLSVYFNPMVTKTTVWLWMFCLAMATSGFLFHNWSPAKIFMGDVGSTFLAFMIFFFALITISLGWINYAAWAILVATFVIDASVTLFRRILVGENILEGHRSHLYQHLADYWGSHQKVTLVYLCVNLFWLFPFAWLCLIYRDASWWLLLIAYTPLLLLAYKFDAGKNTSCLKVSN